MNKKIGTIALITLLSTTLGAGITSAYTINATELTSTVDMINLNNTNWENISKTETINFQPSLEEMKQYFPEELKEYKKLAKTDSIKKKLDELANKFKKVSKIEEAQKLEEELNRLIENEKNFDFAKIEKMHNDTEIKEIKKYLKEEIDTYQKVAKTSQVKKKIEEIKSKLSKVNKIEDAHKLENDFHKLLEDEKNFDYDKLNTIQNEEEFRDLKTQLNKNYKGKDKAILQEKLEKLEVQSKQITEMQKKINDYYNEFNDIHMKIYPDTMINFIETDYEKEIFQITNNKEAIEIAKILKKDNVTSTLDNYFDKKKIKEVTSKIEFVEDIISYYIALSNEEAHNICTSLEKYLENLKK